MEYKILICLNILININSGSQAVTNASSAIANESWPFVQIKEISIRNNLSALTKCGGTLLDECTLLTAAHCVANKNLMFLYFRANTSSDNYTERIITNKNVIVHPSYNMTNYLWENDMAVIKLTTPLTFKVLSVKLPKEDHDKSYEGITALLAGWGITDDLHPDEPKHMQIGNVTIMSNRQCSDVIHKNGAYVNPNSTICTNSTNVSVCGGDSGGPLFQWTPEGEVRLIGVISFSFTNNVGDICVPGLSAGIGRITSSALNLINSNIGCQTNASMNTNHIEANLEQKSETDWWKENLMYVCMVPIALVLIFVVFIFISYIIYRCKFKKKSTSNSDNMITCKT